MNTHMNIICCPGCGRPVPRGDLDLPHVKRRIFDLVNQRPGISAERLCELVWADDPSGGPESGRKAIHVHVNQLNRRLASFGIAVRGSLTAGYRLVVL
jgi:hypothetical protein